MTGTPIARIEPWPVLFGSPITTVHVTAPAQGVVALLAEELRGSLRVQLATDRRSLRAKTRRALALAAVQILNPVELFSSPVLTVAVLDEGPDGTSLEVAIRTTHADQMRTAVPDALNRSFARLAAAGVTVTVGPWDRWFRSRRVPV